MTSNDTESLLTDEELEEVHHERKNEHHHYDLRFLVLYPAQSPAHAVFELWSNPENDQYDDLHHCETSNVNCCLFSPQREREGVAVVSRLVMRLVTLHECRRILEEEVDEKNAESCID